MPVVLSVSWSYLFMVVVLKVKPYLPHEWTPKGMLERVNAFSEYYVSAVSSNSLLSIRTVYLAANSAPSRLLSHRALYSRCTDIEKGFPVNRPKNLLFWFRASPINLDLS